MTETQAERGLCGTCTFARVVTSNRGSSFVLCGRAEEDPRFAKYPRLPVLACPGYEPPRGGAPTGC